MICKPNVEVKLQVFSMADRLLIEKTFNDLSAGDVDLNLVLRDVAGDLLSNGCYHVVVNTPCGRAYGKVMLMR